MLVQPRIASLRTGHLREDYPLVALDQLRSAALREDFTLGWIRKQKERSFRER